MNLHAIASGVISAVNPMRAASVQISSGSTPNPDGTRTPTYLPAVDVFAQVQPLSTGDIRHLEALNIQPKGKGIYVTGHVNGLVRPDRQGGDLITMCDGTVWLVTAVLENYPEWVKFSAILQNGA